jgi:hypothetical protein
LSLTFTPNLGVEDIYLKSNGVILRPNMSSLAPIPKSGEPDLDYLAEGYAAHVLGIVGSSYISAKLPSVPLMNQFWHSHPAAFWRGFDRREYHFLDTFSTLLSLMP